MWGEPAGCDRAPLVGQSCNSNAETIVKRSPVVGLGRKEWWIHLMGREPPVWGGTSLFVGLW
jgi:hypothetical protein